MTEEGECCVCFERFNAQENFPLRSINCKHLTCFSCVKNISKQGTELHVKCPLCRNSSAMDIWKPDIEILERTEIATYQEIIRKCSYPQRRCYICLKLKPFNDHHICLTCHPNIIRHIVDPDLSFSTNKTLCSDCDVYHCLFHENKDNTTPPLAVPMGSLVTQDSFHVLTLASTYLNAYDLHSDAPILCVALLRRYLHRDVQKPLNKDVVYFLLSTMSNSDYFLTIPENRCDELRDVPETYVNFYREYLGSLQLIIKSYREYVDYHIIRLLIEVTLHISSVIKTWADSIIQDLFNNYIESIYRYTYYAMLHLDKETFNTHRLDLVPRLVEVIAKHECFPASTVLSEIVKTEMRLARAFNVQTDKQRKHVDAYCKTLERDQNDYELRYFHYVYKSVFNKGRNPLAVRNIISIT